MKFARFIFLCAVLAEPSQASAGRETAVLAGGCYWGMQEVFEHVKGVTAVVAGFAGPSASNAEAVMITFDPSRVSYNQLLQVYFTVAHDPTQVDRQGPDVGPSYRSAVYPQTPDQAAAAQAMIKQFEATHIFATPVATKIEQGAFKRAGPDQQDFAKTHPDLPYVLAIDLPKVRSLKKSFPNLWKN